VARGDGDLNVAGLHPGRAQYHLDLVAAYRRPDERFAARLERLQVQRGARLDLGVVARWEASPRPVQPDPVEIVVVASGTARAYRFAPPAGSVEVRERLVVTPGGAELAGRSPAAEWAEAGSPAGLTVRLRRPAAGGRKAVLGEERLPLRSDGNAVEVLVPDGRVWTAGRPVRPAVEVFAQASMAQSGAAPQGRD
jgi:hypothetical protein